MTGICNYSLVVHLKNGLSNACFARFDESDGGKGQLLRWSDIFFVLVVQKKEKEKVANLPNSLE